VVKDHASLFVHWQFSKMGAFAWVPSRMWLEFVWRNRRYDQVI
jgi:hypothetical protein